MKLHNREIQKLLTDHYVNKGHTLYHYTSMATLYNMLKNKELWWGSMASMNDREEITGFINKLFVELQKNLSWEHHNKLNCLFDSIRNSLIKKYPFAMCFSSKGDDAAQWERYADNASGVCIEINRECFDRLLVNRFGFFYDVKYEYDIRCLPLFEMIRNNVIDESPIIFGSPDINEITLDYIVAIASMYKNVSFSSEGESRIVTPVSVVSYNNLNGKATSSICYELINKQVKKVYKISLVDLSTQNQSDYFNLFSSIIIGPRSLQNVNELREFCFSMGFQQLSEKIFKSECPLR